MKALLLFFIFPLLLPQLVSAQFTLSGRISDAQTGEVLSGAHIILENTYMTDISQNDGSFVMKGLPAGTYDLKISYLGYETYTEKIKIEKD